MMLFARLQELTQKFITRPHEEDVVNVLHVLSFTHGVIKDIITNVIHGYLQV